MKKTGFLTGLVIGAVTSGVVVALTTPKKGVELRGDIKKEYTNAKDVTVTKANEYKEKATEVVNEYKEKANEYKEEIVAKVNKNDSTKDLSGEVDELFAEEVDINKEIEKLEDTLDDLSDFDI